MPIQLYFDAHIPSAICEELRRKGVDVLTAQEDDADKLEDEDLLLRAAALGRVIFTQDGGFKGLAESWQQQGKQFAGLAFGRQSQKLIGIYVQHLEIIAKASDPSDWVNVVQYLPYK